MSQNQQSKHNPLLELIDLGKLGTVDRLEYEVLRTILKYFRQDSTVPVLVEGRDVEN